ncbi:MAG: SGNH/GDSL hydrolase family protein [Verrucomicrobiaceae bacterium]
MKKMILPAALLILHSLVIAQPPGPKLEFLPDERVILIGGTLVEREQKFGFLESELILAAGEKHFIVRNLGWSGDTVFGHARSYFGPPQEGLDRLGKHLEMLKPTLIIACYGADLAFASPSKIPGFIAGYGDLLDQARSKCPGVRFVIIAPPPMENLGPPLPDAGLANANLATVRDALKEFAAKKSAHFVDGFALMGGAIKERPVHPLTDNGIHYGEDGYRLWAARIVEGLGLKRHEVPLREFTALRQEVIRKDFLFFNRWRPANETYLFGFRKHEQGKNGAEMQQFDPLVNEADQKTLALKNRALAALSLP